MKKIINLLLFKASIITLIAQNPVVYQDINYGGEKVVVEGSCMNFYNKNYCESYWGGEISSIVVPSGWVLELYDQKDYQGNQYNLNHSIEDLGTIGWNDRIYSIKVVGPNGAYLSGIFWPGCIEKVIKIKEVKEPKEPKEPKFDK